MKIFKEPLEFHWDKGNIDKNDILPARGRAGFPAVGFGCLFLPASSPTMEGRSIRRSENKKHNVENNEVEEPFFDRKRVIFKDILHSGKENRFILIGKTKKKRLLYTVLTMRGKKVRIISSRDVSKKEVQMYEKRT